jgi:hypothetical protein
MYPNDGDFLRQSGRRPIKPVPVPGFAWGVGGTTPIPHFFPEGVYPPTCTGGVGGTHPVRHYTRLLCTGVN